jgi:hypothetical protein
MKRIIIILVIGLLIVGCGGKKYPNVVETKEMFGYRTGYDAEGNEIYQSKIDDDGKPELDDRGVHTYEWTYDNGNRVSESRFGINGEPVNGKYGTHRIEWTYDKYGYQTSLTVYDKGGKPAIIDGGTTLYPDVHRLEWENDPQGNIVSEKYFDSNKEPMNLHGHHEERIEWDTDYNIISESYFNFDGEPAVYEGLIDRKDCHKWERIYDDDDNYIGDKYYDIDGNLIKTVK